MNNSEIYGITANNFNQNGAELPPQDIEKIKKIGDAALEETGMGFVERKIADPNHEETDFRKIDKVPKLSEIKEAKELAKAIEEQAKALEKIRRQSLDLLVQKQLEKEETSQRIEDEKRLTDVAEKNKLWMEEQGIDNTGNSVQESTSETPAGQPTENPNRFRILLDEIDGKIRRSKAGKATVRMAAVIASSIFLGGAIVTGVNKLMSNNEYETSKNTDDDEQGNPDDLGNPDDGEQGDQNKPEKQQSKELTGNEYFDKQINGTFEQEDNDGCWREANTPTPTNSVGDMDKALRVLGLDSATATVKEKSEVIKHNEFSQVAIPAVLARFLANEGVKEFAEFKDVGSYTESAKLILEKSKEEKGKLQDILKEINDKSTYSETIVKGKCLNEGFRVDENKNRYISFEDANFDEGVKVIAQTITLGEGTLVAYYKMPCINLLQVYTVIRPDGSEERKRIEPSKNDDGKDPIKPVKPEQPTKPEEPTTKPEEPTTKPEDSTHPHKNEQAEKDYAGEYVTPMKPGTKTSETAHENQEKDNRDSVKKQGAEDARKAAAAQEAARAQKAQEEAAKTQQNTPKPNNPSANNAAAERAAAEKAAREQAAAAQKAANEKAAAERAAAEKAAREQAAANEAARKQEIPQANTPDDFKNVEY